MRIALFAIAISSSAQAQNYAFDPYSDVVDPLPIIQTVPEIDTPRTVTAGDSILDTRNGRRADGAIIEIEFKSPPKIANAFHAQPGDQFFKVSSKAVLKACTVTLGPEGLPACFLDDDGDGKFDRVASNTVRKAYPVDAPVPYRRSIVTLPPATSGFTRTLLYQGATQEALKLSYREFKDDLARPAFEEDLTIPLSKEFPQQIAAKGAVFTIFKITGLGIEYKLDAPGKFVTAP